MQKTLAFGGHPPKLVSIRNVRKKMGCILRIDGDDLLLATFGEWASRIEGGKFMKVLVYVPDGVAVEQREGLSGPKYIGNEWQGEYLTHTKDATGGFWCCAAPH